MPRQSKKSRSSRKSRKRSKSSKSPPKPKPSPPRIKSPQPPSEDVKNILSDAIHKPPKIIPKRYRKERSEFTKNDLLNIYYNRKDLCGHFWFRHQSIEESNEEGPPSYIQGEEINANFNQIIETFLLNFEKAIEPVLVVHIDSWGGSAFAGQSVFNLLYHFPKPVITVIERTGTSAAATIFLSGDLRILKPYTFLLFHQQRYFGIAGKTHVDLKRFTYGDKLLFDLIMRLLLENTKMTEKQATDLLKKDIYLSNPQSVKYGIAHHIFNPKKIKKKSFGEAIPRFTCEKFEKIAHGFTEPEVLQELNVNKIILTDSIEEFDPFRAIRLINIILEIPVKVEFITTAALNMGDLLVNLVVDDSYIFDHALVQIYPIFRSGYFRRSQFKTYESTHQQNTFVQNMMDKLLKTYTKLSPTMIKKMKVKVFDFTSKEAVEHGIVDNLISRKF